MPNQTGPGANHRSHFGHDHDASATDVFQLQTVDDSALSFIKPSDVVAFHATDYGRDLPYAGMTGGNGDAWSRHPGSYDGHARYSGRPETFQRDSVGTFTYSSFPAGWSDPALVDPHSLAPKPSAVVMDTTGADSDMTKALATLPGVAESQGIYRMIDPAGHYATRADVRIDQFGDNDPSGAVEDPNNPGFFICGCPVESANLLDWPMQVSFANLDGVTDPTHSPAVGIAASTQTHTWHLFGFSANVFADFDLGLSVEVGKWYGVEVDFTTENGAVHGAITDAASGKVLADETMFLTDPKYGKYDPSVDGLFNAEAYLDSELTLVFGTDPNLNKPGLAVIDNIDVPSRHGFGRQDGHHGAGYGGRWSSDG